MLTDGTSQSIPANSTVNVFSGRPIEFLGVPTGARFLGTSDAPGLQFQWLINLGPNQMVPIAAGTSVGVASLAGAGPKDDEDTMASGVGIPAGGRSQGNVTNTTGAAIVFRWRAFLA